MSHLYIADDQQQEMLRRAERMRLAAFRALFAQARRALTGHGVTLSDEHAPSKPVRAG